MKPGSTNPIILTDPAQKHGMGGTAMRWKRDIEGSG
jgi:hypothetical protein